MMNVETTSEQQPAASYKPNSRIPEIEKKNALTRVANLQIFFGRCDDDCVSRYDHATKMHDE